MPTAPTPLMSGPTLVAMPMSASPAQRVYVDTHGGVAAGSMLEEIFSRFCQAQFHADWDDGLARWGGAMTPSLLERNDRQRRFDALLAIFTAAAQSVAVGTFEALANIVVDETTLEHHLAKLPVAIPSRWLRRQSMIGVVKRRPATSWILATCSLPCFVAMFVGSCSTPPVSSSTWVVAPGCSPAPPATPCSWAIDGVPGPDATFAPGAAKPITPNLGPLAARPGPTMADPPVHVTTDGSNAATEPGATPMATGTRIDPTEPEIGNLAALSDESVA